MEENIKKIIKEALIKMGIEPEVVSLEHPADFSMGDYSTNVAMMYAKKLGVNPRDLAEKIIAETKEGLEKFFSKIEVAGPGFINFYFSKDFFVKKTAEILDQAQNFGHNSLYENKKIMIEYTQPNPFKPFHIGHLMSNAIGESLSRIVEFSGAQTIRANYQGDVGLHVAKAIYGLLQKGKPKDTSSLSMQAEYIGTLYSWASNLYEEDEKIKNEIDEINKKVYSREDQQINDLYDWGRKITLDAFEIIYKKLGTKFDYYYFESDMAKEGAKIVRQNIGKVFSESDGAIIFKGEDYDKKLHTRVFITKASLPTYEAKEIGLTMTKFQNLNPDLSITETAVEQGEYMKVVQKAVSLIHPEYEKKMLHITHGMMRFASGKMSSRKGNIITGESLIHDVENLVREKIADREISDTEKEKITNAVSVSAIKYSILRQAIGGDIIYDFEKSISFEGDSGPYLQYTYARARSILTKAIADGKIFDKNLIIDLKIVEPIFELEKMIYRFPEVVKRSSAEFAPHYIANYLIELSRAFNTFYGSNKIIGGENESYKLALTSATTTVLKNGLYLLGIESVEKM